MIIIGVENIKEPAGYNEFKGLPEPPNWQEAMEIAREYSPPKKTQEYMSNNMVYRVKSRPPKTNTTVSKKAYKYRFNRYKEG